MVGVTHLLDTNVCIEILRNRGELILRHLELRPPGSVALSTVSLAELAFGAQLSNHQEEEARVARLLKDFVQAPFGEPAAWRYGKIRCALHKMGTPIGQLDMMIAAIALEEGWTLVTHNRRDFSRIDGLRIEDWQTDNP